MTRTELIKMITNKLYSDVKSGYIESSQLFIKGRLVGAVSESGEFEWKIKNHIKGIEIIYSFNSIFGTCNFTRSEWKFIRNNYERRYNSFIRNKLLESK